jgi:hypothetical protein
MMVVVKPYRQTEIMVSYANPGGQDLTGPIQSFGELYPR